MTYREIWTIEDLEKFEFLKESSRDKLFDADYHTKQKKIEIADEVEFEGVGR